uniref:H(+)-transporting two-sector ATPase n=1 Tax=Closterium baillyanum TaxID=1416941 RepID=U5YDS5_9VIRI|nr:ATP synthase F0 subunit 8 [Closterium baillyanum]AGZ90234.1 ATP synthase F0 subunit 8 [Closterium baillyanum]
MPQLDQFTYLTQFVWLCVFYMTFYVLLYNDGLPKISRILKLRAHLVSQQSGAKAFLSNQDVDSALFPVQAALKSSLSYLYSSVSGASKWCSGAQHSLNANQLFAMNKSYLRSLGSEAVSQVIKYSALDASAPITFISAPLAINNLNEIYILRVQRSLLSNIKTKKKKKL